jgi:hypothetical protein
LVHLFIDDASRLALPTPWTSTKAHRPEPGRIKKSMEDLEMSKINHKLCIGRVAQRDKGVDHPSEPETDR